MPFPRNRGERTISSPESDFVCGATGGASLYKTSLFKEIGLFDESFFAYYEDVDISFRAQLAGHKVYFTNKAIAYHKQGATSSKIPGFTVYQTFKNIPLLYTKNVPSGLLLPIGVRLLLLYVSYGIHACSFSWQTKLPMHMPSAADPLPGSPPAGRAAGAPLCLAACRLPRRAVLVP